MLPATRFGANESSIEGPLIIALHWLGGSARTWTEVGESLAARGVAFVALDLSGFGDAAAMRGYSIAAMRDEVMATVRNLRAKHDGPWLLAGHSMGGKVSATVARAAIDGAEGLQNLRGLVLISPSPPSPEPMDPKVRQQMLEALGHATGNDAEDRKRAAKFVDDNVGKKALPPAIHERTVDDVLRMNRAAFRHWLDDKESASDICGSKEDWSERVGTLPLPALICAGSEEPALGSQVQREQTAPHFAQASVVSLEGSGHLSPLEQPAELVQHIAAFLTTLSLPLPL